MLRTCQACGKEFDTQYVGRGRPRKWCRVCQPEGMRLLDVEKRGKGDKE